MGKYSILKRKFSMNRMAKMIQMTEKVPFGKVFLRSKILGNVVPFTGTSSLSFEKIESQEVIISLKNTRSVQNHIKQVHACAMALVIETATGFVVGMNVPDDKILLIRELNLKYIKRSIGRVKATATLTQEQIDYIKKEPRGDIVVPVTLVDEELKEPLKAEAIWAWREKKQS